jgi:large subunit ribosomal protein L23
VKDLKRVLRRPLITEKSTLAKEISGQLVFEVDPGANKIEIRQAVESIFDVKVLKVRTIKYQGKKKRMGRQMGRRPHWKKAYVTLVPGHSVEFFEGA